MRKEHAKGVEEWGKVKRRYKRRRLMTCEGACGVLRFWRGWNCVRR
jgi:hypothetical protein